MLAKDLALPSYDELKQMGIYKRKDPNGHFVAYRDFRKDPLVNPLKTPSVKSKFTQPTGRYRCQMATGKG